MKAQIRVISIDDHPLINSSVESLLLETNEILYLGSFTNPEDAISFVQKNTIDVIICDMLFGINTNYTGIYILETIKKIQPLSSVIFLTMLRNEEQVKLAFTCGASGWVLKTDGIDEIMSAIKLVYHEKIKYFSKDIINSVFSLTTSHKSSKILDNQITNRELEVLLLVAQEYTPYQISEKLFVSIETVNSHRKNIKKKLNIKSDVGLANYVFRNRLLEERLS